jgi:hypothetical protein
LNVWKGVFHPVERPVPQFIYSHTEKDECVCDEPPIDDPNQRTALMSLMEPRGGKLRAPGFSSIEEASLKLLDSVWRGG